MADENFGIIVEIDPRQAVGNTGAGAVDKALEKNEQSARDFEREAKAAMAGVARAAREAAKEQERAARAAAKAAADGARQSAAAQKASAREVEDTARAMIIAAERRAKQREEQERRVAAAARQSAQQQKATIDHLSQGYKAIVGPLAEYNQKLSLAIQLERRGAISAQQRAQYVRGLQREITQYNAKQQGGLRGAVSSIASSQLGAVAGPAAIAATAIAAGREVIALSDAYQNLTNRIRTVTDSEAEAIRVRGQLLELANRTRSDLGATTEGYVRLAAATKNLRLTQSEMLSFTESLNKTIKLSGATSSEAQAGLIQFAQGLGAGALRGDELRSVMEQLGPVADVIAKKLGTTRAGLKAFGEQGKITADVVVAAFREQREEIDGKFGKTVATFSDLWTVLHNSIEAAVGQIVEATGGLPALGSVVQEVSGYIGEWAHGLAATVKGLRDLITEIPGLGGAIVKLLGNKDVRAVLFSSPLSTVGKLSDRYYANRRFGDAIDGTDADKLTKQLADERAQEVLDAQRRQFVATDPQARREALEAFAKVGQRISDGMYDEAKASAASAEAAREHAAAVREAAAAWKDWLGEVRENGAGVLERTAMRIEDVTSSVRDLAAESIATAEATRVANENMIAFATTLGEDVLAQLSAAGDMVSEFADKGETKLSMFAETMADQLGGALRGSLDLLVEWASGADVSLSAFASSVAASMARAMAAMLAFEAIKATIGVSSGSFGAALASSLGFGGFAAGGSFTVPNSGGGTDSVPVAFRATPGERVTISPPGGGSGGAERAAPQPVNVNAYLVHDAEAASIAALNTPAGTRAIIAAIAANPGAVRAAVGR